MNRTEARAAALTLMRRHGLGDWEFQWDRAKKRFGQCRYRSKTISLSSVLVPHMTQEAVIDTILHEIAHALTPGAKHGPAWRAKAQEIGANPVRCSKGQPEQVKSTAPYAWHCDRCKQSMAVYRRPKYATTRYRCGRCKTTLRFEVQR